MVLVGGQQLAHVISIETTAFYANHRLDRDFCGCRHSEDASFKFCLAEFAATEASKDVRLGSPGNSVRFGFWSCGELWFCWLEDAADGFLSRIESVLDLIEQRMFGALSLHLLRWLWRRSSRSEKRLDWWLIGFRDFFSNLHLLGGGLCCCLSLQIL